MSDEMDQSILSPIQHVSVSDQAYLTLRESILRRVFEPGQQLDMDRLESQLGVSRTPLKHALTRLELEGLVKIAPRRGTYVTELNAEDIAERFDARRCIEVGLAELAIRNLNAGRLHNMRQLLQHMEELVQTNLEGEAYLAYIKADHEFHLALIELAQNELLREMYEKLKVHLYVTRVHYGEQIRQLERANREHKEILQALEARDLLALQRAVAHHLEESKQDMLRYMSSNRD